MNKNGFTLVELLAVIAILAILVIVAMPNVLEMFNQAKINTFVTEVQTIIDKGTSEFMTESLKNNGKELVFYNNSKETNISKKSYNKLDMSGNEKNYYIKMNRNGEIEKIVVWDDNFCYDSGAKIITKEKVQSNFVHESSSTNGVTWNGNYINGDYTNSTTFTIIGCDGTLNGILYGDVNLDGEITVKDVAIIAKYLNNNVTFSEEELKASDVNLDGNINQTDVDIVRNYITGASGYESLPVQE